MPTREAAGIDPNEISGEEWDAAQRLADAVNLHVAAGCALREAGKVGFVAIDLADGSSDGVLYESREDATRAQRSDYRFYVKVGANTMASREAALLLLYSRRAHKAGVVFTHEQPLMPHRLELAEAFIPRALRGAAYRG
ncbi:hypothetical protein [Streptomyces sp. NBC_00470]|uniref:hypothetical protein n=1 Tax=Streptomyces sp. NBC_00470 TaxID=2975753 RepID=UPI0030E572D0